MTTQHTPSPWLVREHNDGFKVWHEPGDGLRSALANVNDFYIRAEHGGTALANARLIAAAPDLLEAAQQALDQKGDWLAALEWAIAKATGGDA